MTINIETYFARIAYTGKPDVSSKTLKELHAAQVFAIPFENLSIHDLNNVNNPADFIALDEESLFNKLVIEKRGGYCHELNELFALVLLQLGFKVDRLAARVLSGPNRARGHKLLMVTIGEEKWIADVGFGGYGIFEPMPLIVDQPEKQYCDTFKMITQGENYILQIQTDADTWRNLYEFDLEVFQPVDYKAFSYYVSHVPDSFFVQKRFCVMPTPKGRVILLNNELKIIENGQTTVRTVSENEYAAVLKEFFGISLGCETKLKPMPAIEKEHNTKLQTNNWCNYFASAAIFATLAGVLYQRSASLR